MILDIIVTVVLAAGFYLGYLKGIIKTVFESVSFFVATLAALKLSPLLIDVVQEITGFPQAVCYLIGVLITFIGVFLLVRLIGNRTEALLQAVHLNVVNKIAGGLLQAVFFCYLLSLVIWAVNKANLISPGIQSSSITYSYIITLPDAGKKVIHKLTPVFTDFWDATVKALDSIGSDSTDKKREGN